MPLPKNKVTVYDKRIALYKKRINKLKELARDTRVHYGHVVAKHVNAERNLIDQIDSLTTAAIQDRFKLQDYEAQIANQWRENAGLRDDVATAKLYHDAKARELQNVRWRRDELQAEVTVLMMEVARLERSLTNRLWVAVVTRAAALRKSMAARLGRVRTAFINWKSQIVNRWMIRRLSRARVAALYEAGHIPDKLVRSALAFYEHDKRRLEIDEQIKYIHGGDRSAEVVFDRRPGLWRRFKIFIGRA